MLTKIVHKEYDEDGDLNGGAEQEIFYEKGLKTLELTCDLEGNEIHKTEFIYEDALVIQINEIRYQELAFTKKFVYNSEGKVVHELHENGDGEIEFERELIEEENTIIEKQYGATIIKKLNDQGNVIEELEPENTVTKYQYEGNNLVRTQIFEHDELSLDESYYFDEHGNEIGSSGKDLESGEEIVIKRQFSDFNKVLLHEEFDNGKLSFRKIYAYDDKEQLIKERVETIETGEVASTEYFYE